MSGLAQKLIEDNKKTRNPFLDLGNCGLNDTLPDTLMDCIWLEKLNFSKQYFDTNTKTWVESKNLMKNNVLNGYDFDKLKSLQNLTHLHIGRCSIEFLHYISTLKKIRYLDIHNNEKISDYATLIDMTSLRALNLSYNNINDIRFLQKHKELEVLLLDSNSIKDFTVIENLISLEDLSLGINKITNIEFLYKNKKLKKLKLHTNYINNLHVLRNFEKLGQLDISSNLIRDISPLKQLLQLQSLNLSNNKISNIDSLDKLIELETLYICKNEIYNIQSLKKMIYLEKLDLSNNYIYDIQPIEYLTKLKWLNLSYNKIYDILPLEKNKKLRLLNLCSNNIEAIPLHSINSINIEWKFQAQGNSNEGVFLFDNPLPNVITNAIGFGRSGLIEYLKSIQSSEDIKPLNECKVIFVGLGSSGKTSLMRRLYDGSYQKGENETHGINKLSKNIEDIKINFWDFGGQYIQHSLHQFFFTQKTLYILVLDRRKNEKPEYWLEQIESLGKDSAVMVVFNKVDSEYQYKEEKTKEIQDKYRNIIGFYYLSCETGYSFSVFLNAFQAIIKQLPNIQESYHNEFFELKKTLEGETKEYISYDTYEEIFNRKRFKTIENKEFWLKTLHQIGTISYFPQVPDYQILNPEWLTVGIYHLFLHPTCIMEKKGRITVEDLIEIFRTPVKNNITKEQFSYQPRHHIFLLNLMKEFQLCSKNPHNEKEWLIPTGFSVNPKISFDEFRYTSLMNSKAQLYAFKYDTWIPSTILRVIASTIQWAYNEDYWQNGILLKHPESFTQALIQGDEEQKMIKIWLKGERVRDFWIQIDSVISSISNFFDGNKYQKLVFLDEMSGEYITYQSLLNALLKNKRSYYNADLDKEIDVLHLLGMFQEQSIIDEIKKNKTTMENERSIQIQVNPIIKTSISNSNSLSLIVDINKVDEYKQIKELLLDLEEYNIQNEEWKKILLKALDEFIKLEDIEEKSSQKTSISIIDRTFKKLKDFKDVATIALLPVDIDKKLPELLALWDTFKSHFH